jgi:hypothetical protein
LRAGTAVIVLLLGLFACVAAPRSYFATTGAQVASIDYAGWDALLRENVHDGFVDYPAFLASERLSEFLDEIRRARLNPQVSRQQRLALLINAYNACALDGILDGGSPTSLVGRYLYFQRRRHPVAGEEITLWDLEHHRLQPLGEPRIHFAIVCASASCPKLASFAYRPDVLEGQLERVTVAFVNDPSRNRFDRVQRVAHLSAIFEWYAEDFGGGAAGVLSYVARYVEDPDLARELMAGGWTIQTLEYDWSLNGVPPRGS